MTFLITYYIIGLILALTLLVVIRRLLGKEGVWLLYQSEYRDTKLSEKEVYVYFHIAILAVFPIAYGVWLLEKAIEYIFKKLAPNKKS